ncbi:MAG: YlxR family protein [Clostridia bacterium]
MSKKEPMRMCVVCKTMFPKHDLFRLVKNDNGIVLDFTGKEAGRGAYICKNDVCIKKCVTKKMLNRIFECSVDEDVYQRILDEYTKYVENC